MGVGLCGTFFVLAFIEVAKWVRENNIEISIPFTIISTVLWTGLITYVWWSVNHLEITATWNSGVVFIVSILYLYPTLYSTFRIFYSKEELSQEKKAKTIKKG